MGRRGKRREHGEPVKYVQSRRLAYICLTPRDGRVTPSDDERIGQHIQHHVARTNRLYCTYCSLHADIYEILVSGMSMLSAQGTPALERERKLRLC